MEQRKNMNIAVVGATGMVGKKLLSILEERKFPLGELRLLASAASAGRKISFAGKELEVAEVGKGRFEGCEVAFFCAGGAVSRDFAPVAAAEGAIVVDKSSHFRMDDEVPLVVPEVNAEDLSTIPRGIVASPNCSTIPLVMVLAPLLKNVGITRVIVSTYQAVSGAGREAIDELRQQAAASLTSKPLPKPSVFPRTMAFNLIPHIDKFVDDCTKEEMKVVHESRKILHLKDFSVTCTAVRVPVINAHSESVTLDFERPVSPGEVREILASAPGVVVMDDPAENIYPVPEDADGRDEVLVGRIRQDTSRSGSINLWLVCDNLRKGAATNAVQIAEELSRRRQH